VLPDEAAPYDSVRVEFGVNQAVQCVRRQARLSKYQGSHRAELSRRSLRLLVLFASAWGVGEIVGLLGKERAMWRRRSVDRVHRGKPALLGRRDPFAER
jgi:hypothetical protein